MTLTTLAASHLASLGEANRAFSAIYPGDRAARQPVHTVYGGAQLYKAETTQRLGELALASFGAYASNALELATGVGFLSAADIVGLDPVTLAERYAADPAELRLRSPTGWLAQTVYDRVKAKLEREAVEDFRIDFEDGFGARPDAEEDETAERAARELAHGARKLAVAHLAPEPVERAIDTRKGIARVAEEVAVGQVAAIRREVAAVDGRIADHVGADEDHELGFRGRVVALAHEVAEERHARGHRQAQSQQCRYKALG